MTKKIKHLLYYLFTFAVYGFFIVLALGMRVLWISVLLVVVFASGIAIPIYWRYHFRHSGRLERERMVAQKQLSHYYYDRWYTPADSTEIDYQIERIKKRSRH
jgi:hypothetical protein